MIDSIANVVATPSTLRLPGGAWTIWTTAALRGAGFAASTVLELAGARAAAAADEYLRAEAEVSRLRRIVLAELPSYGVDAATRATNLKLRRKVHKSIVRTNGSDAESALGAAIEGRTSAHAAFVAAFEADTVTTDVRIREISRDPRFQEAVLWQNHGALRLAMRRVQDGEGSPRDRRKAAALVAKYLQRYCVKNDTVGFFGPVGWVSLADAPEPLVMAPGPDLIARRDVMFEGWCIDALAAALDANPAVRPWTAPRRKPGVWVASDGVWAPVVGRVPVTRGERLVLQACDGTRTATELASAFVDASAPGCQSEGAVIEILQRLVERNLISWRLETAPQLYPERELAAHVSRIGDEDVRGTCVQAVGELIAARDEVAAAAGRPAELDVRLQELDETFTRLTGQQPTRRPGETYAARRLVYEDCARACEVTLGRDFLERVGPPLSVMLDGARWAAGELATAINGHLRRCHAVLRARSNSEIVDGHLFFSYVRAHVAEAAPLSREVIRRFQERWQTILELGDERRCTFKVEDIASKAAIAFSGAESRWSRAGYISPDIMIAARGPEALRRGEFHCVLGEVHGSNTLATSLFLSHHPDPKEMIATMAEQTRDRTVVQVQVPKHRWLARTDEMAFPPASFRYEWGDDPPTPGECRSMPAGMLVAVDDGRVVRMRARDGSIEFDALELFGLPLCMELHDIIGQWLPTAPHTPRITIGDLTVSRERWYMSPSEITGLEGHYWGPVSFAAIRAWARSRGLPRFVFYKQPDERKPCYLDFDSPLYVTLFAKVMRQVEPGTQVRIVEMLPSIDETWLVDGNGTGYTSELRIVARPTE